MPDIYFEDVQPGEVRTFGSYRVDRDDMVAFAREFDAQPFHLDEQAAAASPVGRLIASGWYTCAVQMRLICDDWLTRSASLGGLGIDELGWLAPVVAGDVLSVRQSIVEARPSASMPGLGIVRFVIEVLVGGERPVMRLTHVGLLGQRGHAAPRPAAAPMPASGEPASELEAEDPRTAPRFYEDVVEGRAVDLGTYHFTPERILAFAGKYDPQAFHLDLSAAAEGPFGALAASGWHTAAAWMSRFAARLDRIEAAGGRPHIGVSPGFTGLRWRRPVLAGEVIRFRSEPIEKRPLASRPGWGLVRSRNSGVNARGDEAFEFTGTAFWRMRET